MNVPVGCRLFQKVHLPCLYTKPTVLVGFVYTFSKRQKLVKNATTFQKRKFGRFKGVIMEKNGKFSRIKCLFLIILFSFSNIYAEDSILTKKEIWDKMSNDVDHWIDGIGYPMDEEIKEIVIALNIVGIKTAASCEGHFDHGYLYPWVHLETFSIELENLTTKMSQKLEEIESEKTSLEKKYPDLSFQVRLDLPEAQHLIELYNERYLLSNSYDQVKIHCLEPVNKLLNQFYENCTLSYDRALIISNDRLQSIGADRQVDRSEDEQNLKLVEYRKEMKAFATFLKNQFMHSNQCLNSTNQ